MLDNNETTYMLSKDDVFRILRLVECLNETLWHLLTSRVVKYSRDELERELPCQAEEDLLREKDLNYSTLTKKN